MASSRTARSRRPLAAGSPPRGSPPPIDGPGPGGCLVAARLALLAAICAAWVLYQTPSARDFVDSADSGFSLAGGAQIVSGEIPYVDFLVDFGPLVYYSSAAAQVVSGNRLIGEVALATLALTLGYVLTFLLARTLTGSWLNALAMTAAALLFVPGRFLWTYPFVVGPLVVIASAAVYLRRGGFGSLALLALAVTVCGLFRHDYGAYALIAGATAIAFGRPKGASLIRVGGQFAALVVLFALPWLLTVFLSERPWSYFEIVLRGSLTKSSAFGLPHPLLHWGETRLSLLYAMFFLWPLAGLGLVLLRRRTAPDGRTAGAALAAVTCVFGSLVLATASYRADYAHLLYVVPSSLLCLAAVVGIASRIEPLGRLMAGLLLTLGVTIPSLLGIVFYHLPASPSVAQVVRSLALMSLPNPQMLERLSAGKPPHSASALFASLRQCTREDQRILVFPYFPQAYYFSERPLAGKVMAAAPGYFADPRSQEIEIEALRTNPPAIAFWHTALRFDHDPERSPVRTHARLFEHVSTQMERRADFGAFSVFVPPGTGRSVGSEAAGPEVDTARCVTETVDRLRRLSTAGAESPAAPRQFQPGDRPEFFDGAEMLRVELAGETRNAIRLRPGQSLKRTLEVKPGTGLELATGLLCPGEDCGRPTFRVGIVDPTHPEVLWEETREEDGWTARRVDLHRFAGQRLELRFTVDESGAGETPALPANTFWGEPLILEPRDRAALNLVLISIDTLRADRLGSYGYHRDTSPHLDALAADGVLFRRAISQAPWTTPAHMSLLTSLYPSAHGVNRGWSETIAFIKGQGGYRILPAEVETLAELLRDRGYRTYARTGGATMAGEFGFARGFDVYREQSDKPFYKLTPSVSRDLHDLLAAHRDVPFFLFFHTFEVHAPYTGLRYAEPFLSQPQQDGLERLFTLDAHQPIQQMERYLAEQDLLRPEVTSALYDGGIRATDAFLGGLFDQLKALDLWDRTLIVVTSDHGEEFGDHDPAEIFNAHGHSLYEELLHVPLILRMPGRFAPGTTVEPTVELIDVAPTVLDLLGLPIPAELQGQSLRSLAAGDLEANAVAGAFNSALSEATSFRPELKALRVDDHKLIAAFPDPAGERTGLGGAPLWELVFDLARDPGEQHSLTGSEPELLKGLRRQLAQRFAEMPALTGEETTVKIDEEAERQLRALGYID